MPIETTEMELTCSTCSRTWVARVPLDWVDDIDHDNIQCPDCVLANEE